jgi:hypothetical protein
VTMFPGLDRPISTAAKSGAQRMSQRTLADRYRSTSPHTRLAARNRIAIEVAA